MGLMRDFSNLTKNNVSCISFKDVRGKIETKITFNNTSTLTIREDYKTFNEKTYNQLIKWI